MIDSQGERRSCILRIKTRAVQTSSGHHDPAASGCGLRPPPTPDRCCVFYPSECSAGAVGHAALHLLSVWRSPLHVLGPRALSLFQMLQYTYYNRWIPSHLSDRQALSAEGET